MHELIIAVGVFSILIGTMMLILNKKKKAHIVKLESELQEVIKGCRVETVSTLERCCTHSHLMSEKPAPRWQPRVERQTPRPSAPVARSNQRPDFGFPSRSHQDSDTDSGFLETAVAAGVGCYVAEEIRDSGNDSSDPGSDGGSDD